MIQYVVVIYEYSVVYNAWFYRIHDGDVKFEKGFYKH